MRQKYILFSLLLVLAGLVTARALAPEPAVSVWAESGEKEYNVLDLALPGETETAGSAMIGELNAYFLGRAPTAKNAFTGALRGKNLVLICADAWTPDPGDREGNPALCRLAAGSAAATQVWRPDWYQGEEGRLFALLTGMVPTRVRDETALAYTGEQNIYLPFALGRSFARAGYDCLALLPEDGYAAALTALGFGEVRTAGTAEETVPELLAGLESADGPALLFCRWEGDGEPALARLLEALSEGERRTDTALCLLAGDRDPKRAQLYFWGAGLSGAAAAEIPVSELDVAPTLLNLFGLEYDARFLSGRDIFAPDSGPGDVSALTPLVTLGGSAYAPWVTDAGRYDPVTEEFRPTGDGLGRGEEAYIRAVCRLNYDRYMFARRVMETNYFHLLFAGRE